MARAISIRRQQRHHLERLAGGGTRCARNWSIATTFGSAIATEAPSRAVEFEQEQQVALGELARDPP